MEYQFDCYVVRVTNQPDYAPPQSAVAVYLGETYIEGFTVAHGTPTYTVISLILALIATLPVCPS